MTVSDLIKILEEFDGDKQVKILFLYESFCYGLGDVIDITSEKHHGDVVVQIYTEDDINA